MKLKNKDSQRGYTLIELLVVIACVGILVGIGGLIFAAVTGTPAGGIFGITSLNQIHVPSLLIGLLIGWILG